ncbi:prepilin peptidase [Clostridium rectalis]|uniref:prepilin peptidase n=1 Tax=Clostridium rectalis TaxID=2040295 RepID=UPI000F63441F|nr:A24 family peptidase [Clostridium rectalis]
MVVGKYIFTFILGIIIGSFLNVCIYRIPREENVAYPPSHCPKCFNKLKWYDLIPIISYFKLKGRCRYCNENIGVSYTIVELTTGILFVFLSFKYDSLIEFFKFSTLICILIVISIIDIKTMNVYFNVTVISIILAIIFIIIEFISKDNGILYYLTYIYGGSLGFFVIALIVFLTNGMGWGDAEICLICGLFMGFKLTIVMMFFAFLFGAIIASILILLKKVKRKDYIPFGPFIALGCTFAIFFGKEILFWYLNVI